MLVNSACSHLRVGFIGFGEAASGISRGLIDEGIKSIKSYDIIQDKPIGEKLRKRAKTIGVELVSLEALAKESDVIISAVVCASAVQAAQSIVRHLSSRHIYVDINATSPITKKEVANTLSPSGCKFVDAAVMNPVPPYLHKVAMMISGSGAEQFKTLMDPFHMNLTLVAGEAGTASSVKMLRSIFMKGMAALFMEMLVAAYEMDIHELVLDTIRETLEKTAPNQLIHRLVAGTAIHAGRRVHEMEEVIDTLKLAGVKPTMSSATREVLAWVDSFDLKSVFQGEMPQDYITVLQEISNKRKS
ncbi:MAG TPA: NAD(P)-dependent oxidoreductase [Corynebacteriales bacterium]|jgi:3-hydroxyisobutyrate dehydrogenase-like beta-hydroxyacid dehydrogenase|nr:NAD(P)-dependent oxidoreductase [Mycobacteriales bacterium]